MRYRQLGDSDLQVSEISLGSWLTYGGGVGDEAARACVDAAFEVGITFIDTANVYALGGAEEFLGDVLQTRPRDSYVLATKLYFPMDDTGNNQGLSRQQVEKQIDDSLRRLRTDHVDLYQCHRYDKSTPLEETMEALTDVVRQGKARYIGFSEWSPAQIQAAVDLSATRPDAVVPFVSSQPQYSMLWRRPEQEVIPLCAANGIGQIVWSPLGQGVLTGKYRPGSSPPPDSRAASESMGQMMGNLRADKVLVAVDGLRPLARRAGVSMAQLALAWVLREPDVASAIIGATRPEQVDDNAAASGVTLDADLLAAIDDVLAPFSLVRGTFDVLTALRRAGAPYCLTPKQLTRSLLLSGAGLNSRLNKLESLRYIARLPEPSDRRTVRIHLTATGEAIINDAIPVVFDAQWRRLTPLGEKLWHSLIEDLTRLADSIDSLKTRP